MAAMEYIGNDVSEMCREIARTASYSQGICGEKQRCQGLALNVEVLTIFNNQNVAELRLEQKSRHTLSFPDKLCIHRLALTS